MDSIQIKTLTLDELAGVVQLYPWYGAARKELCLRMAGLGGSWGRENFAEAALYLGSRKWMADLFRSGHAEDCSDADAEELVRTYIRNRPEAGQAAPERKARVVGGDYFSQSDYDRVREKEDGLFSKFAVSAPAERENTEGDGPLGEAFCTETLGGIYREQGYYEQARQIYSRLLLKIPEKNAYFASLIEEIDKLINN